MHPADIVSLITTLMIIVHRQNDLIERQTRNMDLFKKLSEIMLDHTEGIVDLDKRLKALEEIK